MDKALSLAKHLQSKNLTPADLQGKKDISRNNLFLIAYAYYLLELRNKNTKKHYQAVIDHFIRFMANTRQAIPLDSIGIDISLWRDDLARTGGIAGAPLITNLDKYHPHEKTSIHNKLAILSAFFRYLQKPGLDGSPPLITYNPVDSLHDKIKVEKYGRSKKISHDILKKVLKQINLKTVKGLRDYALVYGYFITGRRNSEWVSLKWGQLNFASSPFTYTFVGKGGKHVTDEFPAPLLNILLTYLKFRWGADFHQKIHSDTYLFTAIPGRGGARQIVDPNHPLTERSMLRVIKCYAKKAGIDTTKITVHSLRHLHAESYLAAGASVEEVRARLCHESLATTQQYVSTMNSEKNRLANKLDEMVKSVEQHDASK
jgi:site-specific recombinase XerD